MKTILVSVCVFLVVGALGGTIYGEKEDAINEVQKKYDSVISNCNHALEEVKEELKKGDLESTKNQVKNELKEKKNGILEAFSKELIEATRSAIARGKPVQTIECITKVSIEGKTNITRTEEVYTKAINEVKDKRDQELGFRQEEINLITNALKGLKEQSLENLKNATNANIKTIKADAFKKVDNAEKQLHDIEEKIQKPILKDLYSKLKKNIGETFKAIRDTLSKKIQKCLGN